MWLQLDGGIARRFYAPCMAEQMAIAFAGTPVELLYWLLSLGLAPGGLSAITPTGLVVCAPEDSCAASSAAYAGAGHAAFICDNSEDRVRESSPLVPLSMLKV